MRKKTLQFSFLFFEVSNRIGSRIVSKVACERVTVCDFLSIHSFAKEEKIEGRPFGDIEENARKVSQSRRYMHKKMVEGETRTHVLVLGRPQKTLINLYAQLTLVWQ